jgi:hypothetical protein
MSVLPQLERELLTAHRRANRRRRRFFGVATLGGRFGMRWPTRTMAAVPIVLTVVVTLAVALVALAVHHGGSQSPQGGAPPPSASGPLLPAHPSRRQQGELDYLFRANGAVQRRDPACQGVPPRLVKPTLSQGFPSAALLSILSILRRAAGPGDELPPRITYNPYQRDPNGTLPPVKDIYARYIRYARHRDGANYYLVPAGNVNYRGPVPARCYTEIRAALRRELPSIPASLRAGTLALEPRFLAQMRHDTLPYPGVCLLALNSTGNGDGGCGGGYRISDIEEGHTVSSGAPGGVPVVYGLAPDGVRSVTFYYPGRYPGHPLTVLVIANVFILHDTRDRLPNNGFPRKMVWRSASGQIIKVIELGS